MTKVCAWYLSILLKKRWSHKIYYSKTKCIWGFEFVCGMNVWYIFLYLISGRVETRCSWANHLSYTGNSWIAASGLLFGFIRKSRWFKRIIKISCQQTACFQCVYRLCNSILVDKQKQVKHQGEWQPIAVFRKCACWMNLACLCEL